MGQLGRSLECSTGALERSERTTIALWKDLLFFRPLPSSTGFGGPVLTHRHDGPNKDWSCCWRHSERPTPRDFTWVVDGA